ncbi:DNA-directed RNA polymerase subunit alpha [Candidatus Dojkabacteria bacterium]|nr:DNA-directed RNA polymerase subunit alpha [Candidatus Dojkabacteria bacterium]
MIALDKFRFNVAKEKGNIGVYQLGPLPKGYGVTVGNALRRILLSSIEGAAITSVRIAGIKHEYSMIPGVLDDMLSILLKLKKLALRCYSDKPQTIELDVKGKKKVKAKDIKLTSDVEIANPELAITELTDSKAKLNIKMTVEKGAGYVPSDEEKRSQVGVIPLDADFSPVKRVVLKVTKTRVGQQTDLDQVDLEVYTNDALSPRDAFVQAADIYKSITQRLIAVIKGEAEDEGEEVKEKKEKDEGSTSSDLDIDKINLSPRLTNSLIKAGYKNLTELEGKTLEEIMEIRGLGKRSAEELVDIMKSYKLKVED